MAEVRFSHVYKYYRNEARPAVTDFNLTIQDGEFMVMVGPSGCGKSTSLRMLAGLEEVSQGEIYIGDKLVNYVSPKNRNIAMVFQNYALYPNHSVFGNIALGLKLRKVPKYEIEMRVNKAGRTLDIAHLMEKRPNQLSGGQKQRVALGRAIVREPEVFLMDEPLSNLDAKLRSQTRAELSRLHQQLGITTVYVTHDQTEAMTMGNRITVLKDGEIQQVDTPENIYDSPCNLFVAGFIGSPSMNFLEGSIVQRDSTFMFENRRMRLFIPDRYYRYLNHSTSTLRNVVLGIRPEHMSFADEDISYVESSRASTINSEIDMIERMGSDVFIYANIGTMPVIVRTDPHRRLVQGERKVIRIEMDKVHLFDKESGASLCV